MREKLFSKKLNKEQLLLLGVIFLAFPLILVGTGTITSGWHLVDDHETVEIVERRISENISFWAEFKREYLIDITHRWRPAYWFFRVLGAYIFGSNSVIHNLFLGFMGMVCYWLLYQTARNLKSGIGYSHIFAISVIFGRQYEIWYRVANQENMGLFFLAICLWILTEQYKSRNFHKKGYDVVLLFSAIMCSLIKESFFLMLPGIVLVRLGLEGILEEGGIKKWVKLLINRFPFWGISLVAFLWSAYMIVFYVGTAPISYAGVDVDAGWKQVVWDIMRLPKESLKEYFGVTIVFTLFLLIAFCVSRIHIKSIPAYYFVWTFFGIYIVISQMILYAKSGMWNRYLVPFTVGYGILFVIFAEPILRNRYIYFLYTMILTIFLGTRIHFAVVNRAIPYAEEGRMTRRMLQNVIDNTMEDSNILISLGTREEDGATGMYLEYGGRKNVHLFMSEDDGEQWKDEYYCSLDDVKETQWDAVVTNVDNSEVGNLINPESEWRKEQFGKWFTVWVRE